MITKASVRRFLWRYFPTLHAIIYHNTFNDEEKQELMEIINHHIDK